MAQKRLGCKECEALGRIISHTCFCVISTIQEGCPLYVTMARPSNCLVPSEFQFAYVNNLGIILFGIEIFPNTIGNEIGKEKKQ